MADVASQIIPALPSPVAEKDELVSRLDDLLEQYLYTLDAYQKAQQQLTKHLSSGYISLAQANFNNNAHTRYGQDYFDERMQASRRFFISEDEGKTEFLVASPAAENPTHEAKGSSTPSDDSAKDRESAPTMEADEKQESDAQVASDEKANSPEAGTKKKPSNDPLRWFGVLVPPALRSAQASFVSAVEGPIAEISSLLKELKQQEIEIRRVRKQIKKL